MNQSRREHPISESAQNNNPAIAGQLTRFLLVGHPPSPTTGKDLLQSLANEGFHCLPAISSLTSKRLFGLFEKENAGVDVVLIGLTPSVGKAASGITLLRPFLRHIRERHSTACVILAGPPLAVKDISALLRNGVYDYLTPPTPFASLVKTIRRGLKNKEQVQKMMLSLKRANREISAEKEYFKKWSENLTRICNINQSITGYLNVDDLLCSFGDGLKALLPYSTLSIFLKGYDEPDRAWIWTHASPTQEDDQKSLLQALHDEAIRYGKTFLSAAFPKTVIQQKGAQMLVPLIVSDEKVGLLSLTRDAQIKNRFDDYQARLLSMVTTPLCLTLHNARMYQRVNALASTDELTHVLNRRAFFHIMEREFRRAIRLQTPLAVLFLDLDLFKGINDRFGHLVGDTVLKEAAALLKRAIRDIDVLARYGGEEFAVLLADGKQKEALLVAERIRHMMEAHPFNKEGDMIHVTVSIGVASLASSNVNNAEELFHLADQALYRAKKNGRNRIECATQEKDLKPC